MTIDLAGLMAVLVVFVATPLSWIAAVVLWRLSRQLRGNRVVRAQAWAAFGLALIVTVFAIVFVNNDQEFPPLDVEATRLLTRGILLVVSISSSVYWLRLYRSA